MKAEKARKLREQEMLLMSRPTVGSFRILEAQDRKSTAVVNSHVHDIMENSSPEKHHRLNKLDFRSYETSRDNSRQRSKTMPTRHKI
jgi:hypothetical protein